MSSKYEKKDIIKASQEFYHPKTQRRSAQSVEPLIPTKAALFGLDQRFKLREIAK